MTSDQLLRFTFEDLDIRGELVTLEQSWQEIAGRDDYPFTVRHVLGEAVAASALLSATIKYDGSLILQIQGSGPFRTLVAQATHDGDLRGLARWEDEVSVGNLQSMFGQGQMAITLSKPGKEPHQSLVALHGEQLADVLEHYFLNSEQLASRFWFFVSDKKVAGLFLQQLPSREPSVEDWERVSLLAATTTPEEILSLPPEELLHRLFHEEKVRLFEPAALRFNCSCSSEKIESTLFAMGKQSLQDILDEEERIEVNCEFCNHRYNFTREDIESLFSVAADSSQLH